MLLLISPASSTKRVVKSYSRAFHTKVERVERDAVAAEARPGRTSAEPERLGRGGVTTSQTSIPIRSQSARAR
jgi:hypothetical protein